MNNKAPLITLNTRRLWSHAVIRQKCYALKCQSVKYKQIFLTADFRAEAAVYL